MQTDRWHTSYIFSWLPFLLLLSPLYRHPWCYCKSPLAASPSDKTPLIWGNLVRAVMPAWCVCDWPSNDFSWKGPFVHACVSQWTEFLYCLFLQPKWSESSVSPCQLVDVPVWPSSLFVCLFFLMRNANWNVKSRQTAKLFAAPITVRNHTEFAVERIWRQDAAMILYRCHCTYSRFPLSHLETVSASEASIHTPVCSFLHSWVLKVRLSLF